MILINYLLTGNSIPIESMTAYHGLYLGESYSFRLFGFDESAVTDNEEYQVCGDTCYG